MQHMNVGSGAGFVHGGCDGWVVAPQWSGLAAIAFLATPSARLKKALTQLCGNYLGGLAFTALQNLPEGLVS
jgi:hypothetical protein